jgi:hypothetical protein
MHKMPQEINEKMLLAQLLQQLENMFKPSVIGTISQIINPYILESLHKFIQETGIHVT